MRNLQKAPWPGWKTIRLIGQGSFGTVYEIQRELVDGTVETAAMKVLTIPQNPSDVTEMYSEGYDEESITATFQAHLRSIVAEYTLMRKLDGSANVVNCKDISYIQHDDGIGWNIYIRMELLTPLLKALPDSIDEETVVKLARDICAALVLCKKYGIVHRDIKPQNIFISANGDYKLGDFGIAKTVEKTMGGTKIGTYKYMAPEVYNNQPYGSAADIYSLGLVLYWMLNERRMPFMPLPPARILAAQDERARQRRLSGELLPPPAHGSTELKRIVLKACAYAPKDRYCAANEMLADLKGLEGEWQTDSEKEPQKLETDDIYQSSPAREKAKLCNNTQGDEEKTVSVFTESAVRQPQAEKRSPVKSKKMHIGKMYAAILGAVLLALLVILQNKLHITGTPSPALKQSTTNTETSETTVSSTMKQNTSNMEATEPTTAAMTATMPVSPSPASRATEDASLTVPEIQIDSSIKYISKDGKLYFHDFSTPSYTFNMDWSDLSEPGHISNATDARGNTYSYGIHMDGPTKGPYWITIRLDGNYKSFSATCAPSSVAVNNGSNYSKVVSFFCDDETTPRYETPNLKRMYMLQFRTTEYPCAPNAQAETVM